MQKFAVFAALKAAGLKQKDIAQKCGVSSTVVSQVLNGRAKSHRIATAVAEATGLPMSDLFPDYAAGENKPA